MHSYETRLLKGVDQMCLNCGSMRAHDDMGKPGINFTYEDVKRAAEANGKTIAETLETIARTSDKDRADHPEEYVGLGQHPGSVDPKPGQES